MNGRPRGTGGKAEELTTDEIRRIDKCLTGTRNKLRNRALLYLGLGSGMRISEMIRLHIKDVAPKGRVKSRIVLEKHSTKSKKSRTVAVSKQAVKYLQEYINDSKERPDPIAPLFPSTRKPNKPMSETNAIVTLKKMFLAAGVENASSHSLRRTHANTLRRQGADLKVIQEQLGHSSLAVTERYFSVDPLEVERAINGLKF